MSSSPASPTSTAPAVRPEPPTRKPWEADPDCGMRLEIAPPSDPLHTSLLVTFGGIWNTGAQPGYEFVSTAKHLPGSALFLTDIDQVWYQSGVRGVAPTIEGVAEEMKAIIRRNNIERVVMIGNSAGGYAALLFGALVGADAVHAFGPQTELVDPNYGYFLPKLTASRRANVDGAWLDLRRALTERLPDTRRTDPELYIHYSRYCSKDIHHASRMEGIPGIQLVPYHNVTHGLATALRDAGMLNPLLTSSLAGTPHDTVGLASRAVGLLYYEVADRVRHIYRSKIRSS